MIALPNLEAYLHPTDLPAALRELKEGGSGARLMAGGTDLVLHGPKDITTLVDLGGLRLSYVEEKDGTIAIGATTTLTEILEHPAVASYLGGVIPEMLRQVGSPLLRNRATIGGNLMRRQPWSDVIPLFCALGASATLFDGESRPRRLDDIYAGAGHPADAILTEVVLPEQPANTAAAFRKYTRSAVDVAILNCAALTQVDDGRCADIRLLVGATPRLAETVPAAEDYLIGQELTTTTIKVAAAEAAATVRTGDDLRSSATYRTHLVAVGITQCLEEIRHRLGEAP